MWVKSSRQNTCLKMFRVGVLCWCIWEYLSISHCSVFLTHSAGKTSFPITFFLTASFSGFPSLVSPLVYFHYFLIWNKKGCFFFSANEIRTFWYNCPPELERQLHSRIRCSDLSLGIRSHSNPRSSQGKEQCVDLENSVVYYNPDKICREASHTSITHAFWKYHCVPM